MAGNGGDRGPGKGRQQAASQTSGNLAAMPAATSQRTYPKACGHCRSKNIYPVSATQVKCCDCNRMTYW
jgi:hypothetical protein